MGFTSRVRSYLGFGGDAPVTEAAPATTALAPSKAERAGFEYGVGPQGLNEVQQGAGTTDRRGLLQQLHEAYLACPWAWASVNAIARTVTAGGLVTDWDADDGEGDEKVPDKPLNVLALERLLAFTNEREDSQQLMRGIVTDLLIFGDAFVEVVWYAGIPVALYSLDCPSMSPVADEHGRVTGYVQVTELGQRAEFAPHEVIHVSLDSPRSSIFGVSPTQAALLPVTAWLFAAATIKEIFRKGNPPTLHVDFPAGKSPGEINRWLAQHAALNVGPRNIGNPVVTIGGAKVNELKQGSIAEYLAVLDQRRDEIVSTYGVPPAEAGIIESGNIGGGTGESQHRTFLVNTCDPIAGIVLEKLNYALTARGFGIVDWRLKFAEVDMRDSKVVEEIRDMRIRNGLYVLNKGRSEIGEPPVEGGDTAVIIDRQNIVRWADLEAFSSALVASKATGTNLELVEPKGGQPAALQKVEPKPTPPALAGFADKPGQPADGKQPPLPPGDAGKPVEALTVDGRVSEAWLSQYVTRRRRTLAEQSQTEPNR